MSSGRNPGHRLQPATAAMVTGFSRSPGLEQPTCPKPLTVNQTADTDIGVVSSGRNPGHRLQPAAAAMVTGVSRSPGSEQPT